MNRINRLLFFLTIITVLLLAACSPKSGAEKVSPSSLEPIEGTEYSRVILTEKAFERLHIETTQVREEAVNHTNQLSSEVVTFPDAEGSESGNFWVRVMVSESQQPLVDRSAPVHIRSFDDEENGDDGENGEDEMIAEPDDRQGDDDDDDDENTVALYYKLKNAKPNLSVGQRMLVELPLVGSGEQRRVIPYAAVIYGVHGETWVYTNPEPLVFVRQPIVIDFIQGDWAVLSEGPEVGTAVVTVGGAELFGAETGVSK